MYTAPPTAANLIQQGAAAAAASNGAARRPLTPNGTAEAQQQVQVRKTTNVLVICLNGFVNIFSYLHFFMITFSDRDNF